MAKYTDRIFECERCYKKNSFLVHVLKKDDLAYYLTQCPRCKSYDEVRNITLEEYESLRPKLLTYTE